MNTSIQLETSTSPVNTERKSLRAALLPGDLPGQIEIEEAFEQLLRYAEDLQDTLNTRELAYEQLYLCVKDLQAVITQRDRALLDASAAAAAKNQFLNNISHEFRTPLTSILGFSEFLSRNATDVETRDMLARIQKGGKRIEGLVNNLLTMARLQSEAMAVAIVPCNIAALLLEVCAPYREKALAKGVTFRTAVPVAFSQRVLLDPAHIRQALSEILDNALRFTSSGVISVRLIIDAASGHAMRVEIEDTGIGIHPEDHKRILTAFEQADGSSTRAVDGAGLGLTIAEALLDITGCQLTFHSEPGKGSLFSIELPQSITESPQKDDVKRTKHA